MSKISLALGLLNSMVACGERHSDKSRAAIDAAFDEEDNLRGKIAELTYSRSVLASELELKTTQLDASDAIMRDLGTLLEELGCIDVCQVGAIIKNLEAELVEVRLQRSELKRLVERASTFASDARILADICTRTLDNHSRR